MNSETTTNDLNASNIETKTPIKSVDESLTVTERLTDNAIRGILPSRYLTKNEAGETTEDIPGMFRRVADNVAAAEQSEPQEEKWADEFEKQMTELRFMPNSPTLMNAGTSMNQLSACFVLEPEDDMESIFENAKDAALVFQSGGGVGYAFSHLRPKGAYINSTGGEASGPVSFMRVFDETCNQVKQGGKRRGAQMGILRADHPDVGRFITAKRDEGELSNFNISVGVTDEFIGAVENDENYTLYSPEEDYAEPYGVREATVQFYDPSYQDNPEDAYGRGEGAPVSSNLWRDYADEIRTIEGETLRSKWEDRISLNEGEDMELPARFIWDVMIDGAYQNGEPGLFNFDESNRQHSFDVEEYPEKRMNATNPCVTGDTLIPTSDGLERAGELAESGHDVDVVVDSRLSTEGTKTASNVYKTGEKDVFTLKTDRGYEIRVTEDHRIKTPDGWTEVGELDEGDTILIQDREGEFGSDGSGVDGRVLGWLVGDGHLNHSNEAGVLDFYDDDSVLADDFAEDVSKVVRSSSIDRDYAIGVNDVTREGRRSEKVQKQVKSERLYEFARHNGLIDEKLQVPDQVFNGSEDMVRGFLSALFTADGGVQGTKEKGLSVRLASTSKSLLKQVEVLLLQFGIGATLYEERHEAGPTELPDGNGDTKMYDCQALHEIAITKDNLTRFRDRVGFLLDRKQNQLESELEKYTKGPYSDKFTATVESVEHDGNEAVFDLTEPDTNSFIGNGLVVHNCAEQMLMEHEACNLGHINLSLILEDGAPTFDEYQKASHHRTPPKQLVHDYVMGAINFSELDRTIEAGVRFLDNVVTQSDFPVDEIEETVSENRKIGLGIMGFAQMLYQMGIPYGSEDSFEVARSIMRYIDRRGTHYSNTLAKERGVFGEWENSKYADPQAYPEWFEDHTGLPAEDYPDGYKIRNHNITTIAPTGTTSMIGDTSGGCEPVYNVANFKNVGNDIQGDDVLVEFDDYFLRTLDANGIDREEIKEQAETLMRNDEFDGVKDLNVPESIAEIFVTTQDVSPKDHGRMQRAFQEFVDSGISKTVNLPNEADRQDVDDSYVLAFDDDEIGASIKGLTVYRDGSRDEQVLTTRMDNKLDEDGDNREQLVELYKSDEVSDVAAAGLGIIEADVCPDCGDGILEDTDDCAVCTECWFSPCS
jgi:ribonucleoside-diphosphate reductase alpha chain